MDDILESMKSRNDLIALYSIEDGSETFYVGRIARMSADSVVLAEVDTYGKDDGYLWMPIEQVYRVERKGQYLENIARLAQSNGDLNETAVDCDVPASARDILNMALKTDCCLTLRVDVEGKDLTLGGVVRSLNETTVCIEEISLGTGVGGENWILVERVIGIRWGGDDEKRDQRLRGSATD